ncbi:MAG: histidine kinase [bacterium]|nr:histidine kinase [bacterium]
MVLAAALPLLFLAAGERAPNAEGPLQRLRLRGVYRSPLSRVPKPFAGGADFDLKRERRVVVFGRFDRDIPAGALLIFRLNNVSVDIYQNGARIYSHGGRRRSAVFSRSPGNMWDVFTAPRVLASDDIRVEIGAVYQRSLSCPYNDFFSHIYMGDPLTLMRRQFRLGLGKLLAGGGTMAAGLLMLAALSLLRLLRVSFKKGFWFLGLFSVVSGLWFLMDFNVVSFFMPYPVFNNILDMLALSLMPPAFMLYLADFSSAPARRFLHRAAGLSLLFALASLLLQFFAVNDAYGLLPATLVLTAAEAAAVAVCSLYELTAGERGRQRFLFASVPAFAVLAVFDVVNFMVGFRPYHIAFEPAMFIFIVTHFFFAVFYIKSGEEARTEAAVMREAVRDTHVRLLLSQVKPHFLFNSLLAVQSLCAVDPRRAQMAAEGLAVYLRGNLEALAASPRVPFTDELRHTDAYLSIVELRFGGRVRVRRDIRRTDFSLPPLSLQPLVENAVRHGVAVRSSGGTVTIRTCGKFGRIWIIVADDGVGFDAAAPAGGREHVGL